MRLHMQSLRVYPLTLAIVIFSLPLLPASAQVASEHKIRSAPWMDSGLSPDERAALVAKEMTLDEKVSLLHGTGMVAPAR
jgi:beta-glucosidase